MHLAAATYPLRDLRRLPRAQFYVSAGAVTVAVTFRESWADGLGARGWKLDANLDDPEIIAATSTPGDTIPTSVPVHDILDHLLCGFAPSRHRAEAMALAQLAQRTDIGRLLQRLLADMDAWIQAQGLGTAAGAIHIRADGRELSVHGRRSPARLAPRCRRCRSGGGR